MSQESQTSFPSVQSILSQRLILAVKAQNLETVQNIIEEAKAANVGKTLADMKDQKGWSALHYAALINGKNEVACQISEAILTLPNCTIDILNPQGSTPLHIAAGSSNTLLCGRLIELRANVNAQNSEGRTPLHTTACYNAVDTTILLLKKGADIYCVNKTLGTPLNCASQYNSPEVATALLQHAFIQNRIGGLEKLLNITNQLGNTPYHTAKDKSSDKIVSMLDTIKQGISQKNEGAIASFLIPQLPPLILAVKEQDLGAVRNIIKETKETEVDVNLADMKDQQDWSALHYAAQNSGPVADQISAAILALPNCTIDILNKNGLTPLHMAAGFNRVVLCERLIARDANVNAQNNEDITPLHYSARNNTIDVTKLLLKKGADIYCVNKKSWMPLHFASQYNSPEVATALLQHAFIQEGIGGLETLLHRTNHLGHTPYQTAQGKSSDKIISMLDTIKQGILQNDECMIASFLVPLPYDDTDALELELPDAVIGGDVNVDMVGVNVENVTI